MRLSRFLPERNKTRAVLSVWAFFSVIVIGNFVAYVSPLDRRLAQAVLFFLVSAASAYFVVYPALPALRGFLIARGRLLFRVILPLLILYFGIAVWKLIASHSLPGPAEWPHLLVAATWFVFLPGAIAALFTCSTEDDVHPAGFERVFMAAGIVLLLGGWLTGPQPPHSYLSFGGHPALAGTVFMTTAFFVLWTGRGLTSYAAFAVFVMLSALTTARITPLFCSLYLFLSLLRAFFWGPVSVSSLSAKVLVPLLISIGIFFFPVFYTSEFFPYRIVSPTEYSNPQYYKRGYVSRYFRFLTFVPGFMEKDAAAWIERLPRDIPGDVALGPLHAGDSRKTIYARTLQLIVQQKEGYWPDMRFYERSGLTFGLEKIKYPHNMALEIAYYHGLAPGVLIVPLILLFLAGLLKDVLRSSSPLMISLSVTTLAFLIFFNFSGNLYDGVLLLFLGIQWFLVRISAPSAAAQVR